MMFSEKLKKAMQELNLNQRQVCGMTGKSKGSVSQYLSGKQVPTAEAQRDIAVSLGLAPDFFEQETETRLLLQGKTADGGIEQLQVKDVAKLMHKHDSTIRLGLQQGVFPWGYAIRTSEHRWSYFINARRFAEIEGVVI